MACFSTSKNVMFSGFFFPKVLPPAGESSEIMAGLWMFTSLEGAQPAKATPGRQHLQDTHTPATFQTLNTSLPQGIIFGARQRWLQQ